MSLSSPWKRRTYHFVHGGIEAQTTRHLGMVIFLCYVNMQQRSVWHRAFPFFTWATTMFNDNSKLLEIEQVDKNNIDKNHDLNVVNNTIHIS